MRPVGSLPFFAAALVALGVGRYALGDDGLGATFYVVAPLAFAIAVVMLVVAILRSSAARRAVYATLVSALCFVFAWKPGTSDGEHSVLFLVAGGILAVVAFVSARRWSASAGTRGERAAAAALSTGAVILIAVGALVLVALVVLVILFSQYGAPT